jgi:cell division protein FtsZ
MGGGTGSGASVVVAELARKIGAITLALVTMPFYFEGSRREDVAKKYLEKLEQLVDGMAIMPNNSLLQTQPGGKDFNAVLQTANYYFEDIIQTLSHLFQQKRKFLCDFIKKNDLYFIGTGKDWGVDGFINGVKGAINSLKMLNNIEMGEIKHILTVIAKKKLNGSEDDEVINALIEEDKIVDVVWIEDKELEDDEVKVVVLGA